MTELLTSSSSRQRTIRRWCFYDWANSVYNLVILATIFPIYYRSLTEDSSGGVVRFFGVEISDSVLYSYTLSTAYMVSAFILPLLSGIADVTGSKRAFLKGFSFMGGIACMGLFFFSRPDLLEWGMLCFVVATLGYSTSLVFYDAFLCELAPVEERDEVSARGYSYGYVGSSIMLVFSLLFVQFHEYLGVESKSLATRIVFVLVGVWWIGFAWYSVSGLPGKGGGQKTSYEKLILGGYREIRKILGLVRGIKGMGAYLMAFFFFSTAVQSVLLMATIFASKVLGLSASQLISIILIIQFVAVGGSYLFARLSGLRGNVFSINLMLYVWIVICIAAYWVASAVQFYLLAALVGCVMGGIQSLSRSTFSKFIPAGSRDASSFFSLYDVALHVSIVMGTASFGFVEQISDNIRNSALLLVVFFVISRVLMARVKIPHEQQGTVAMDH